MDIIYPQLVLNQTQQTILSLQESNFFELEDCTTKAAETVLNEHFMEKFIENDDPLGFSSDEEMKEILGLIIIESTFESLAEKGLIGSIEGLDGEYIKFVTKAGEDALNQIDKE